jgi:iron complex outermembrane receptor protein
VHWEGESSRWVAGAYYLHIEGDNNSGIELADGLGFTTDNNYTNETNSYAFFLQGEWDFAPDWTVIGGFRWTEDEKDATFAPGGCEFNVFGDPDCSQILMPLLGFLPGVNDPVQVVGYDLSRSEGDWAGKSEIDWHPNEDWLVYAGVTRGNKAGGFNGGTVAIYTVDQTEFGGEVLVSYEGGFKSSLLDGKARLNATVFHYDYSDFQTFTQFGASLIVLNIDAKVTGAEIELVTNPADGCVFRPNQYSKYLKDLQATQGRVVFGSADWANGWRGSIDGAIERGLYAAREVGTLLG